MITMFIPRGFIIEKSNTVEVKDIKIGVDFVAEPDVVKYHECMEYSIDKTVIIKATNRNGEDIKIKLYREQINFIEYQYTG